MKHLKWILVLFVAMYALSGCEDSFLNLDENIVDLQDSTDIITYPPLDSIWVDSIEIDYPIDSSEVDYPIDSTEIDYPVDSTEVFPPIDSTETNPPMEPDSTNWGG